MAETITIWLDDLTGLTGQFLWLRKADGLLLNTGGDALTESPAGSGQFAATLAESRVGLGTLRAVVTASSTASDVIDGQWLAESATQCVPDYPQAAAGGGDAEQATLLEVQETVDSIAVALAGSSPVETTGRIARGGTVTAYIGDDFRVRSETQLDIPVTDPAAALKAKLEAIGLENLFFGASPPNGDPGAITGTIAAITASAGLTTISVEIINCGADLMPGSIPWQIQSSVAHGAEFDDFVQIDGTLTLKSRAVAVRK